VTGGDALRLHLGTSLWPEDAACVGGAASGSGTGGAQHACAARGPCARFSPGAVLPIMLTTQQNSPLL